MVAFNEKFLFIIYHRPITRGSEIVKGISHAAKAKRAGRKDQLRKRGFYDKISFEFCLRSVDAPKAVCQALTWISERSSRRKLHKKQVFSWFNLLSDVLYEEEA